MRTLCAAGSQVKQDGREGSSRTQLLEPGQLLLELEHGCEEVATVGDALEDLVGLEGDGVGIAAVGERLDLVPRQWCRGRGPVAGP